MSNETEIPRSIADARRSLRSLHLFQTVFQHGTGRAWAEVLESMAQGVPAEAASAYGEWFRRLAASGWEGNAWRAELAQAVVTNRNPFTLSSNPGAGLRAAAAHDLDRVEALAAPTLLTAVRQTLADAGYPSLDPTDLGTERPSGFSAQLVAAMGWGRYADAVHDSARRAGIGVSAYWAMIWDGERKQLRPVRHPDIPDPALFVGYDTPRAQVTQNTERFVQGLPCNDVLLYGDRGTGKSSTVRSLLAPLGARGLRLVEVSRHWLCDLPRINERLAPEPQRFIIFVDDLSFEADDATYKAAKAALEGGLTARPSNVRVYATSNRRHLVREQWTDRPDPGDPRTNDAVDESLSLADRFGLTVVFTAPDQELFMRIVVGLCQQRGLTVDERELRGPALRWAKWYNGASARSARQFVDDLEARLRL